MSRPILLILAAGLGSRYGGAKQVDPVGPCGQVIIDYSMFDAAAAGFERVVFVISKTGEEQFKKAVGSRAEKLFKEVYYAVQAHDDLPEGFSLPEGRVKPWGTAHAMLAARGLLDAPFAIINADDFYGRSAYKAMYDRLCRAEGDGYYMIGYLLGNTLSDTGKVARGVCEVDQNGRLVGMTERTYIIKTPEGAAFSEDGGASFSPLCPKNLVSMNFFGFTPSFVKHTEEFFPQWLKSTPDPVKDEYFLPLIVNRLLKSGEATMEVLPSTEQWYGVTYREDKPLVVAAIEKMTAEGKYPREM